MPTFSSVVHKPGRRTAVPKARPRRNVQHLSMTTDAASTPAQSLRSGVSSATTNESQAVAEPSEGALPTIVQNADSIPLANNAKQTRQNTTLDNVQENAGNAPQPVLPAGPPASDVLKAARYPEGSVKYPPAVTAAASSSFLASSLSKPTPKPLAGRKSKAAEIENEIQEAVSDLTLLLNTSQPASQADVALPSVEASSTNNLATKAKRPAPKPRARPRPQRAVQSNIEAEKPQTEASGTLRIPWSAVVRPSVASRSESAARTEADALLQNVTSQFSAVSRLADGIDGTSRAAITARSGGIPQTTAQTTASLANALNRAAYRQTQARTAADLATEIIGEAANTGAEASDKPKRKRRRKTPEDAEEHIIDPAETKMGDLTRDTGLGKKSGVELALQKIDWKAVKQQQKEKAEETRKQEEAERAEKRSGKPKKRKTPKEAQAEALVPELTVVNGVIVSLAESREIDIRRDAEAEAARQDTNILTIDKLTTRINQNTVGKPKGLTGKPMHWSVEMDERFYKGIRMFGADMLMVSSLFPGIDRRHIKHKFVREERANAQKLREALFNPTPVDAETYQEETGMELGDPRKLDEELKAMEADLRNRFEDQMAEQQAGTHPVEIHDADVPIQSREQESTEAEAGATRAQSTRARENRFNAMADDIVSEALGLRPTGVKKSKKKAVPGRKKKDGSAAAPRKGTKAAKQAAALLQLGGTVEEIGTVDEVPR